MELGYKDIIVKEVSCFTFILSFKTKTQRDNFKLSNISDWVIHPRNMEAEDFRIKRKALVEVRGLPCNAWSEDNLKKITKIWGVWGWWENNPLYHSSLENPKVWIYTEKLDKIQDDLKVQLLDLSMRIKVHEIENAELWENLARTNSSGNNCSSHEKENTSKNIVLDDESDKGKKEEPLSEKKDTLPSPKANLQKDPTVENKSEGKKHTELGKEEAKNLEYNFEEDF